MESARLTLDENYFYSNFVERRDGVSPRRVPPCGRAVVCQHRRGNTPPLAYTTTREGTNPLFSGNRRVARPDLSLRYAFTKKGISATSGPALAPIIDNSDDHGGKATTQNSMQHSTSSTPDLMIS